MLEIKELMNVKQFDVTVAPVEHNLVSFFAVCHHRLTTSTDHSKNFIERVTVNALKIIARKY